MHQIKSVRELLRYRLITRALANMTHEIRSCGSITEAAFYGTGISNGAGVSVGALVSGVLARGVLAGAVLVGGGFIPGGSYVYAGSDAETNTNTDTNTDNILEFSFDIAEDDLNRIVLPFRDAEVSTVSTAEIKNENGVLYVLPADKKPVTLFAQSAEDPLLALKLTLLPKGVAARAITVPGALLRQKPANQNMNNSNKSSNSPKSRNSQKETSGAASTSASFSDYGEPMSNSDYVSRRGSRRDYDRSNDRGEGRHDDRSDDSYEPWEEASSRNFKNTWSWPEQIRPVLMNIWSRLTSFPEANLYRESIFVRSNDNSRGPNSLNGSSGSRDSDTPANPQKGNYTMESKDILFEGESAVIKHFYELGPGFSEEPEGLKALRNTQRNSLTYREGTFYCELLRQEQVQTKTKPQSQTQERQAQPKYTTQYKEDKLKALGSDVAINSGEHEELTLVESVESDYSDLNYGLGIIEPLASVTYQGDKVYQGKKLSSEASGMNQEHSFDENFLYTLMYARNDSTALVIPSCSGSGFRFLSLLNRRGIPPHTGRLFIVVTAR